MLFFAPKWWPTIFVPRSLALIWEAGLNGERGLRAPRRRLRPSSCHGEFQSRLGKVPSTTTTDLPFVILGATQKLHQYLVL